MLATNLVSAHIMHTLYSGGSEQTQITPDVSYFLLANGDPNYVLIN